MNLLGLDVRDLDVPGFLAGARACFLVMALGWLLLLARLRRPRLLLAGVVLANAYVWGVTEFPLQRMYGLGPSSDRVGNLALCQVVAAGNSPLRTAQVGQLHFEPFWGLLVAALSGWNPDRVLQIYPYLPLVMVTAFALSLYWGLGAAGAWSDWERGLIAAFVTLLSSSPLDFTGTYRVPWAMTFLLKPNHALGLVLFPLILRGFLAIRGWRGRLAMGLLLHLLGWVFVIHMAYVSLGLVVFALWSLAERGREARSDVLDAAVVIGVNLLVVSPYLYMLLVGYPFLSPSPRATIFAASAHLLEPTLRTGLLFWLAVWGLVVLYRRPDRLSRLFAAQILGALLLWAAYIGLSAVELAREKDEIYYWLRFLRAASAAVGAWDLARQAAELLGRTLVPAVRAAAILLVAMPWSIALFWDPARMDSYFLGSIPPVAEAIREPTDFLRHETDPRAVVAGDHNFARYAAALGARRVLHADSFHMPPDYQDRLAFEARLVRGEQPGALWSAAQRWNVRYLAVTRGLLSLYPGVTLEELRRRPDLKAVHMYGHPKGDFVAIFELRPLAPGEAP